MLRVSPGVHHGAPAKTHCGLTIAGLEWAEMANSSLSWTMAEGDGVQQCLDKIDSFTLAIHIVETRQIHPKGAAGATVVGCAPARTAAAAVVAAVRGCTES